MASELRVKTLKDASGNNSVATSVVFGGTTKLWSCWDSDAGSSNDSFNSSSLTDNATGASNFAAKGAHRLKMSLTLKTLDLTSTADNDFIEIGRVENGKLKTDDLRKKDTEIGFDPSYEKNEVWGDKVCFLIDEMAKYINVYIDKY